jgi:hypothetical protein
MNFGQSDTENEPSAKKAVDVEIEDSDSRKLSAEDNVRDNTVSQSDQVKGPSTTAMEEDQLEADPKSPDSAGSDHVEEGKAEDVEDEGRINLGGDSEEDENHEAHARNGDSSDQDKDSEHSEGDESSSEKAADDREEAGEDERGSQDGGAQAKDAESGSENHDDDENFVRNLNSSDLTVAHLEMPLPSSLNPPAMS